MRLVEFTADSLRFVDTPSPTRPEGGFLWISLERDELPAAWPLLQQAAQEIGGSPLLDLHCRDLANATHASYYDYTSVYDLVMFRRLATQQEVAQRLPHNLQDPLQEGDGADLGSNGDSAAAQEEAAALARNGHMARHGELVRIHALTVGFAVYDRLLISVHPKG